MLLRPFGAMNGLRGGFVIPLTGDGVAAEPSKGVTDPPSASPGIGTTGTRRLGRRENRPSGEGEQQPTCEKRHPASPLAHPAASIRETSCRMDQKPLELILARNFLTSLSTPAFLVDESGALIFYNEAAGALLGISFEESARMPAEEWSHAMGPFGDDGKPIPIEEIPTTRALRHGRPLMATSRCARWGATSTRSSRRRCRSSPRAARRGR